MDIEQLLINHAAQIRLVCFFGILITMMLFELWFPKRPLLIKRTQRWPHNIALVFFNTLVLKLVFPVAALGFALLVESRQQGLCHALALPHTVAVIVSILLLDFIIYCQHRLFHRIPLLWRLHAVHHADKDYDVTTGSRFHPVEIVLSMMIKLAAIWVIGAPAIAVLLFEIILNGMAMFNHSNIQLPKPLDTILRRLLVTPDMHRVHHSIDPHEMHSNFGFNLSLWDRWFNTYVAQPRLGHHDMIIGIDPSLPDKQTNRLPGMLLFPFRNNADRKINNR